jgi:BlaI family penicillinase repressor
LEVTESFLQRVFDGSLNPMVAHLVENKRLSAKEIRRLRKILDGAR